MGLIRFLVLSIDSKKAAAWQVDPSQPVDFVICSTKNVGSLGANGNLAIDANGNEVIYNPESKRFFVGKSSTPISLEKLLDEVPTFQTNVKAWLVDIDEEILDIRFYKNPDNEKYCFWLSYMSAVSPCLAISYNKDESKNITMLRYEASQGNAQSLLLS
jgi:hypothetical protein